MSDVDSVHFTSGEMPLGLRSAADAFGDDGNTQTISWERRCGADWPPLCDRVARQVA